jgi:hypothetical protein
MSYSFSNSITVHHGQVASTQTDFPVLITGTYSYLATTAHGGSVQNTTTLNGQTVPADLIFTSDSGGTSPLIWEIASYNATTGAIEAWVNIPTLSSSVDTVFYMFYGNASVTTYQCTATSTWDSNYVFISHLPNGTTLGVKDSTINANNGTLVNAPTATTGQIDGGANFVAASDQYITYGTGSSIAGLALAPATYSFWINPSSSGNFMVLAKNDNNSSNAGWWIQTLEISSSLYQMAFVSEWSSRNLYVSDASNVSINTWTKIDVVIDGTLTGANQKFYINGSLVTTSVRDDGLGTPGSDSTQTLYTAFPRPSSDSYFGSKGYFNGALDEIRLSNIARTANWIQTSYNNESSPSTFYTITSTILTLSLSDTQSASDSLSELLNPSLLLVESQSSTDTFPGSFSIQSNFIAPVTIPVVEQLVNQFIPANVKTYFQIEP